MKKKKVELVENALEIIDNLNQTINEAGGASISLNEFKEMSAIDLLLLIAPNNIRFVFIKPKR